MTDVLEHVDLRLAEARAEAARLYDRVAALGELRATVYGFAAQLNVHVLMPSDMWACVTTPEAEAHLTSLIERALPEPKPEGAEL